jgi:hypothetical protein
MLSAHIIHIAQELKDKGFTEDQIFPVIEKGNLIAAFTPVADALGIKISEIDEATIEVRVKRNSRWNSTTAGNTLAGLAYGYSATTMWITETKGTVHFYFHNPLSH